jgi:hypothetical protein
MNKKSWFLILVAVVLTICYVIYFTNWFRSKPILVADTERFGRVLFNLGQPYELTSLKVVSVSALSSNKYALPVWELKSDTHSAPIKLFSYGQHIQGMKPAVADTRPEPLDHGTVYRLFIQAGGRKAQHDFTP